MIVYENFLTVSGLDRKFRLNFYNVKKIVTDNHYINYIYGQSFVKFDRVVAQ